MNQTNFGIKHFIIIISVMVTVILTGMLYFEILRINDTYKKIALNVAESYANISTTIRNFNKLHDGVYVFVTDETQPNLLLQDPLRDIETLEGLKLTKINPGMMMIMVSDLMNREHDVQFSLVSCNPINPLNTANQWELDALHIMEEENKAVHFISETSIGSYFRYLEPMKAEERCLQCHTNQVGDTLGGISVSFPYEPYQDAQKSIIFWTFIIYLLFLLLAGGIILFFGKKAIGTENKLIENEEQYRGLVELSPDAIAVQCDEKICIANKSAAKLMGLTSAEELLGRQLVALFHPDYRELVRLHFCQVLEKKKDIPLIDAKLLRSDGKAVDIELAAISFTNQGNPALQVIFRDITDRKKKEEEHLKISKFEALNVFAGGIAHDFNNILTIIKGNISLAKRQINKDQDTVSQRLTEVEIAATQAKELTQQLVNFSKEEIPVKKVVCIGKLVKDAVAFALGNSNARCEFSIADDLLPVEINEGQIRQAITNLVINALQAMPKGGNIYAGAQNITVQPESPEKFKPLTPGKYIKIYIKDEGNGIPVEYLQKIFDPYFTTKQEGNGLGLASTYSIINKHGGDVTLETEVGVGTIFYIYLPAFDRTKEDGQHLQNDIA